MKKREKLFLQNSVTMSDCEVTNIQKKGKTLCSVEIGFVYGGEALRRIRSQQEEIGIVIQI